MSRKIGLTAEGEREWEGPAIIDFTLYSTHTQTVRYRGYVGHRAFDLYVPRFMLPGTKEDPPDELMVVLDRSARSVRTAGLRGEWRPLVAESDVCEYEFSETKVNSKRYEMSCRGESFSLYVPNTLFGDQPHPRRLFLRVCSK